MNKKLLLLLFLSISSLNAMELIESKHVSSADKVKLYTNHKDIFVEDEDAAYRIPRHDMNPLLREVVQRKALSKFIGDGYIRANKIEDGKYELLAKVRGDGGTGPITAFLVGLGVRVGCYTGYLLGVSTPVVVGTIVAGPGGAAAGTAAVGLVLAEVGGAAGVIAATETLAMKATLGTLLLPIPLP